MEALIVALSSIWSTSTTRSSWQQVLLISAWFGWWRHRNTIFLVPLYSCSILLYWTSDEHNLSHFQQSTMNNHCFRILFINFYILFSELLFCACNLFWKKNLTSAEGFTLLSRNFCNEYRCLVSSHSSILWPLLTGISLCQEKAMI